MAKRHMEKQASRPLGFLIKLIQILLYIPIQILFIPFAILGFILASYKEMGRSRRLGVSFSAIQTLQYRWIMHYFETRLDPISIAFIKKFPCESHLGLWATFGPLILAQRVLGLKTRFARVGEPGEETFVSAVGRRVILFDEILKKHVDEADQIVLPGVGFDLMALQHTKGKSIKVFELDQRNTINVKMETLDRAGIEHDWITYIPVDYEKESWSDKLLAAGFDKTKNTLFIWESVSLFLDEETVKDSLRKMAEICEGECIIAQDFYTRSFVTGEYSKTVKRSSNLIARMGEPWKFGIDLSDDQKAAVESFLMGCGLRITAFMPFSGKLDIEPFYCIVEAKKQEI